MKNFTEIIQSALRLGACGKINRRMTEKELARLLYSPQGREFCVTKDFPKVDDMNIFLGKVLKFHNIHIREKKVVNIVTRDACFLDSNTAVKIVDNRFLHHIIALDHSHLHVFAKKYAVVCLDVSKSSKVEIFIDSTVRVFQHGEGKVIIYNTDI